MLSLSSLALDSTVAYICIHTFSVMPLLSLVTMFVFQADDSNADKNVSSAQIVGKFELETLKAEPFAVFSYMDFNPHALPSLLMQSSKNKTQDFPLPKGK